MWFPITKKYTLELTGLRRQYFTDENTPLSIGEIRFVHGKHCDHSPAFHLYLEIVGYVIVDLEIYNINHAESSAVGKWLCSKYGWNVCPDCKNSSKKKTLLCMKCGRSLEFC